jgi:hypothetical protein
MNPYNKEEWKAYEKANKEKRNARRRELYHIKKYGGWFSIDKIDVEKPYIIITSAKEK